MTVETVLLSVLGVVGMWLALDTSRERHRVKVRMEQSAARAARRRHERAAEREAAALPGSPYGPPAEGDAWRYWPLTLPSAEDGSIGPRF